MKTRSLTGTILAFFGFATVLWAEPCTNNTLTELTDASKAVSGSQVLRSSVRDWVGECPVTSATPTGYCTITLDETMFSGKKTNEFELTIFSEATRAIFGIQTKYLSRWTCSWADKSESELLCRSDRGAYPIKDELRVQVTPGKPATITMTSEKLGEKAVRLHQIPRPGYWATAFEQDGPFSFAKDKALKSAHEQCLTYLNRYSAEARSHSSFHGKQLSCTNSPADCKHFKARLAFKRYYEAAEWHCESRVVLD